MASTEPSSKNGAAHNDQARLELIRAEAAYLAVIREKGNKLFPNQIAYLNGLRTMFDIINMK